MRLEGARGTCVGPIGLSMGREPLAPRGFPRSSSRARIETLLPPPRGFRVDMAGLEPAIRRPGPTLSRYVAREAVGPIAIAVIGLTVVVLTRDLVGFTELVLNRGVGALEMGRITFYEAVQVATTVLPFAGLIGALVALGRLGADHEILALEAAGISAARLSGPLGRLAILLAALTAGLSLFGAPAAQRGLERALDRIASDQPWTQIRAGTVHRFGGWQLEAREVTARG